MKKLNHLVFMFLIIPAFILTGCNDDDDNGEKQIELPNQSEQIQQAYADDETTGGFTFTAKSAWTATVTETTSANRSAMFVTKASSVSWLRLLYNGEEKYNGEAGTFTLAIELETNYTGENRSATVVIESGGDKITITVTQEGTQEDGTKPVPVPSVEELVALCEQSYNQVYEAWLQIDNDYSTYTSRLSLTQASPFLFDFWEKSYEWITYSNLLIEQLSDNNLPESDNYRSKAFAGRATAYFYLKALFGGVPIVTNPEIPVNSIPRNTVQEVVNIIHNDINRAEEFSVQPFPAFSGLIREIIYMQETSEVNTAIEALTRKTHSGELIFRDTNGDGIINAQDENTEILLTHLLLAEAYLKTGNTNEAAGYVNRINAAYAQALILPSDDILAIIRTKYSTLLPNMGMKFLNAVRWGDTQSWGYHTLLPIPLQAMEENTALTQNTGW